MVIFLIQLLIKWRFLGITLSGPLVEVGRSQHLYVSYTSITSLYKLLKKNLQLGNRKLQCNFVVQCKIYWVSK